MEITHNQEGISSHLEHTLDVLLKNLKIQNKFSSSEIEVTLEVERFFQYNLSLRNSSLKVTLGVTFLQLAY